MEYSRICCIFLLLAVSTSTVMCISLFEFEHCSALFSFIHSLTTHSLVKIYKMTVKLRSVYTGKFNLITYFKTTGTMIGFILTIVGILSSFVSIVTNFIIIIGPIAITFVYVLFKFFTSSFIWSHAFPLKP